MKKYYPYPANDGKHKYYIITKSGKTIKFGQASASDFTIHKDEARKQRYIDRHKTNESKYWNKSGIDARSCTFMVEFKISVVVSNKGRSI